MESSLNTLVAREHIPISLVLFSVRELYKHTSRGFDGIQTQASQILIGRNCLLSYKASHWERGKFKRALLSRREI